MGLESTVICLDNSEWMRNGDYIPTRLEAQQDAASLICTARTDSHPENTVGLLTMAGKGVSMLVSPTENIGKILAAFAGISSSGETQFSTSVQIAQLALKHRKNKNGGQRIIIFVGSPIKEDVKALQKIGLLLKKNGIAVDVVVMGEHEAIQEKLSEFVKSANSGENSHLIVVPPGVAPSDALISSPIFQGDDGGLAQAMAASAGGGGGGAEANPFAEYGGVNPDLDPELAMALRLSAEEARAHEETQTRNIAEESKNESSSNAPASNFEDDDDAILQAALAMSLGGASGDSEPAAEEAQAEAAQPTPEEAGEDDDDELQMALQLSLAADAAAETQQPPAAADGANSDFINQLLGSVGVDQDDPLVRAALEQLAQNQTSQDEKRPAPNGGEGGNESKKKREE